MARYRNHFGQYDTGAGLPAGLTALEATNAAYEVVTDAGSEGLQALEIQKTGAGVVRLTLDAAGSATDQDIVVELEVSASGTAPGIIINSTGGAGAANEYLLEAFGTALTIWEGASGSYSSRNSNATALGSAIASGTVYAMRLRRSGTTIFGRIWIPASEDEPAAWHVQYTDPSARSAGGVGVRWSSAAETLTIHYISAADGGDCGCVLADEDIPLSGIYATSETDGSVRVYSDDGADAAVVAILGGTSISNLRGIACHNRDREVYAVARQRDDVVRMDRFGLNQADVVTTLTDPYGVAIDPDGDVLFVSDRGATTVSSTPVHDISLTTIENPGASDFAGYLFWDAVNSKLWRASVSGVYSSDADGTNDTDYDDISEELQAITDGTTVMASDYTAAGGIYTKPVASPGDSWTAADTTSPIEGITLNAAATACWGADNANGVIIKWGAFPASVGSRSAFATLVGVRAVCYFDFTAEAWPGDALLVAAYELEDATDSVGSNDLTETGSPTYVAAVVGNGVDLEESSSQRLTRAVASAGDLVPGTRDLSVSVWWKSESLPASSYVPIVAFGYDKNPGLDPGYGLNLNTAGELLIRVSDGSTQKAVTASGTPYAVGVQYHGVLSLNRTGNAIASVRGAQVSSVDISDYAATDLQPTIDFRIGGNYNTRYFDGVIDEVLIFRRVLSIWESRYLYNGGVGRALSAIQTTGYPVIASHRTAITDAADVTEITIEYPPGVEDGDLLLIVLGADGNNAPPYTGPTYSGGASDTSSAGFTSVVSDEIAASVAVWKKVATSTDATYSANGDGVQIDWSNIQGAAASFMRITGADDVDVVSSVVGATGPTRPVSPGVVTTAANCAVLDVIVVDDSAGGNLDVQPPDYAAPIANNVHAFPGSSGGIALSVAARHQATAGDTGAARWTLASGRGYVALSLSIAPAATASASGQFAYDAGSTFSVVAAKTGMGQMSHHGAGAGVTTATKAALGQLAHDLGTAYSAQAAKGALGQSAHDAGLTGYALSAEVIIRTGQFAHDAAAAFATQASKIGLGQFAYDLGATASVISALIRTGQIAYDAGDAGYAISAKTATGQTVYDGEAIGRILGSNPADLDPSSITISIARLHAIGIEIARLHNITLTISRPT